ELARPDMTDSADGEDFHGHGAALYLHGAERAGGDSFAGAERGERGGGGDDVGAVVRVAREALQARGDVHAIADHRIVEPAERTDVAGDDARGVDADAEREG